MADSAASRRASQGAVDLAASGITGAILSVDGGYVAR
jgi:hypothetical protein